MQRRGKLWEIGVIVVTDELTEKQIADRVLAIAVVMRAMRRNGQ
jgi:hypothetical protein